MMLSLAQTNVGPVMSPASPVSAIQSVLNTIIAVQTLIRNVEEEEVEMERVLGNVGLDMTPVSNVSATLSVLNTATVAQIMTRSVVVEEVGLSLMQISWNSQRC